MKKIYLLIIAVLQFVICPAQNNFHAEIDERIELTSIAFRLAGAEEYMLCSVKSYADDIDEYFAPYNNHPLIEYIKFLREERKIGYARVASSAMSLYIRNGRVRTTAAMTKKLVEEDYYWTEEIYSKYVDLLDDFYRKSKFHDFFSKHGLLYSEAKRQFDKVISQYFNIQWFENTFGISDVGFNAYLSINNGGSNYSIGNGNVVIGLFYTLQTVDGESGLLFPIKGVDVVVHEMLHCYMADIVKKYQDETLSASQKIFSSVGEKLMKNGYSVKGVWGEWITRVATQVYIMENDPRGKYSSVYTDVCQGFIWQERTFFFLENYFNNRVVYKYFQDFVPQLVAYFDYVADNIETVVWEYEHRFPYVVSVYPVPGSEIDLASCPDTISVKIVFSEKMGTHCCGFAPSDLNKPAGCSSKRGRMMDYAWIDDRTLEVKYPKEWIRECDVLAFKLDRRAIQDRFVNAIKEDYEIYYPLKH